MNKEYKYNETEDKLTKREFVYLKNAIVHLYYHVIFLLLYFQYKFNFF